MKTPDFETYPTARRVVAAARAPLGLVLDWDDGRRDHWTALELRRFSPDPGTTHPVTREPTLELQAVAPDVAVEEARPDAAGGVEILWSDGAGPVLYDAGWLRARAAGAAPGDRPAEPPNPTAWRAGDGRPQVFAGPAALADPAQLRAALAALLADGAVVLAGLPVEPETLETVARRIGPIRGSNFGGIFEVRARADADSNAYTGLPLAPHTDLATRERPPGLQYLFSLENDADGGDSVVVDGLALFEDMARGAPEVFARLAETPVPWANKAENSAFRWRAPVFGRGADGGLDTLRWTYWLIDPLGLPPEETRALHAAFRQMAEACAAPAYRALRRLEPGELLIIDNRRVLHGRTGYDPKSGGRWLRGCYGEREDLISTWRVLSRDVTRVD